MSTSANDKPDSSAAERPVWAPDAATIARSAMRRFFAELSESSAGGSARAVTDGPAAPPAPDAPYEAWHAWSCAQPAEFWSAVWRHCGMFGFPDDAGAGGAEWPRPADVVRNADRMMPPGEPDGPAWFPGTRLNFAENLLRRSDGSLAIIARSEGGPRREITCAELAEQAGRCAAALARDGIVAGDRVAAFIPNVPEAVVAMLGASWLGAIWTSSSPDFGVKGVFDRFGQVQPRVLICADGYRYGGKDIDCLARVREIVAAIPSIERVVIVPFLRRPLGELDLVLIRGAVEWNEWTTPENRVAHEMARSPAAASAMPPAAATVAPPFERLPFDHPLYVMYSSGTTGLPKCMVHGAGGTLIQHLKEHQLHCDIAPGERFFYFTTCGWMMWNWLVSGLASGATIVLYDGSPMPPGDPDILWRMAAEERIAVFGTSAKFIALSEKSGLSPARDHDLGAMRMILSTGSPLAPSSFDYVMTKVRPGVHLASVSGGTDIVSCFLACSPLLPVWRGELQCAGLGMAVDVFDDAGHSITGVAGELVCTRPFPSMPVKFWDDADGSKYRDAYFSFFPGVWRHGDWVERTLRGGFIVHGRSDATLNPGGVRIGTAEIYREVEQVPGVIEAVVVGQEVQDATGARDVRVVLFVRLADGLTLDEPLREAIRARLREHASPHHVPKVILQVNDIPRTISGKITELAVRETIHGRAVKNTDAMANPGALREFRDRPELQ